MPRKMLEHNIPAIVSRTKVKKSHYLSKFWTHTHIWWSSLLKILSKWRKWATSFARMTLSRISVIKITNGIIIRIRMTLYKMTPSKIALSTMTLCTLSRMTISRINTQHKTGIRKTLCEMTVSAIGFSIMTLRIITLSIITSSIITAITMILTIQQESILIEWHSSEWH